MTGPPAAQGLSGAAARPRISVGFLLPRGANVTTHRKVQQRETPESNPEPGRVPINKETLKDLDREPEADDVRGGMAANDSEHVTCTC